MEKSIEDLSRRVHAGWEQQGLTARPPKPDEIPVALTDRLPNEFAVFLNEAGLPDDWDDKYFRFWPPEEWIEHRDPASDDRLLVFADFLIDSHRFGIWTSGERRGLVSVVHSDPEPPVGSFAQFLRLYLDDDPALRG